MCVPPSDIIKEPPYFVAMTTLILRLNQDRLGGLRGTVEMPGGISRTFKSDEDLLDILYEWSETTLASGKGSGSTSSSAMRVT